MEDTAEQPQKQANRADHLAPWQYKKGQSGNPSGRPIGVKTLKQYAKEKFLSMNDDEREEYLDGLDKRTIWEMAEDKAKQGVDGDITLTSKVISVDE